MSPPASIAAAAAAAPTPLTPARFRAAIAAVLMTILLGALDQTIVSVAVPTIAHQLGGFEWMAWVVSAYLVASTIVTPLYGKFSDLFGRRAVMTVAIALFVLASAACALAQTLPQLVAARVLQGIGGGGLVTMAQALIADVVPMRERGRFQSYISIVWAGASVAGPVVGGVLTQYLSWPWIFWINLPFGLLSLWLVRRALAGLPVVRVRTRIDWAGVALLLAGLCALLLPITRLGQGVAAADPVNLACLAGAVLLLGVFGWHEQRVADPILPVQLLRMPVVVVCCSMLFIVFFLFIAMSVLVPLRLQLVGGMPPGAAALWLLPLTLAAPCAVFATGRWMSRTGHVRPVQRIGVVLVPLGLVGLALAGPAWPLASGLSMVLLGMGFGCQMPTCLLTVQNSVPGRLVGTATGLTVFSRLLGGAVGIAVLGAVLLALLHDALPPSPATAGLHGIEALMNAAGGSGSGNAAADAAFRTTLWVGAALALVSVWLARHLPDVQLAATAPSAEPGTAT